MRTTLRLLIAVCIPLLLLGQSLEDGLALMSKRKYTEAKTLFESILKKDGKNADAHYRLGQVLLTNQCLDADAAADHMEEAIELDPNKADFHYGLGAALGLKARDAGVIKQAFLAPRIKSSFEKAVQLNPNLLEAHVGLAEYYRQAPGIMGGDMEKAWKEVETVVRLDEIRGRSLKANFLLADKKSSDAAAEMKLLTKNRSGEWRAWRAAGGFFIRNQMPDDAVSTLEKYVAMRPDTADSHLMLAWAYLQKKDADKSMSLAQKAMSLEGESPQVIEVMGQSHELKGQKKEARECYQKLLTQNMSEERKKRLEKKINELQ